MQRFDFPIPTFGKEICHHSNGIKLQKMLESAGSAVSDPVVFQGVTGQTKIIIYDVLDG